MLRIFTYFVIFFSFFTVLKADDRGFRFTPSTSALIGFTDGKFSIKTALQTELTYLMFNQLELGFGVGYHKQHLTQSSEETFYLSDDEIKVFTIPRAKADSMPIYGVLRYNFDLFEDGYFVTAIKVGSYLLIPKDKIQKDGLPSSSKDEEIPAPILRYENKFTNMNFVGITLGYDISDTIFSLEYRAVMFNQNISYINETTSQIVDHSYKQTNHYIGLNVAYKIDLF